jgi:hypothetical protein
LADHDVEEEFEFGLRIMLAGLDERRAGRVRS